MDGGPEVVAIEALDAILEFNIGVPTSLNLSVVDVEIHEAPGTIAEKSDHHERHEDFLFDTCQHSCL